MKNNYGFISKVIVFFAVIAVLVFLGASKKARINKDLSEKCEEAGGILINGSYGSGKYKKVSVICVDKNLIISTKEL